MLFALNLLISATVITLAGWLARRNPQLGGFLVALPLTTMLTLALAHAEYRDPQASVRLARSIFVAVPLTLPFFLPFFFAERLGWSFWAQYLAGTALLAVAYFVHRAVA